MEADNHEVNVQARKSSNLWLYIVLVFLALGIIGISIWLISVKNNMTNLLDEKEQQRIELVAELDSLLIEHNQIREAYGSLADSLVSKDSIIQANAVEIKQLLNTKWEYYKIKKKLSSLQRVAQGYVLQMDSLYMVNHELTEENLKIKEEIKIEKRKNKELEGLSEELSGKVTEASVLKVYNLTAEPVHLKGNGKEVVTDKIRRTERIKVCFTIGENTIIEPGSKDIYIRIAQPNKEILAKGRGSEYTFTYHGETLQYSMNETIDYQNEAIELCLRWDKRSTKEMEVGLYHVDIFEGDNNIGHTIFELK